MVDFVLQVWSCVYLFGGGEGGHDPPKFFENVVGKINATIQSFHDLVILAQDLAPLTCLCPLVFYMFSLFAHQFFAISLSTCQPPIFLLASLVEIFQKYFIAFSFWSPKKFLSLNTLTFSSITSLKLFLNKAY